MQPDQKPPLAALDQHQGTAAEALLIAKLRPMFPSVPEDQLIEHGAAVLRDLAAREDARQQAQAAMQVVATSRTSQGVKVRIPKGTRMDLLGGRFIVESSSASKIVLVPLRGTSINPVRLPTK